MHEGDSLKCVLSIILCICAPDNIGNTQTYYILFAGRLQIALNESGARDLTLHASENCLRE